MDRYETRLRLSAQPPQTWTRRKVVFFGYAGYSDMTVVGPDTILLSFARGWLGGLGQADSRSTSPDFNAEIGLVRINLRWLESTDPYEFNWYFNEQEPGEAADYSGPSLQDYGPWDQRAWARSFNASSCRAIRGRRRSGDSALQLTNQPSANGVVLSQVGNNALQAGTNDSFTVQIMLKTTDAPASLSAPAPTIRNWTLQIVGGKVQFSLFDTRKHARDYQPSGDQRRPVASYRRGARRGRAGAETVRRSRRGSAERRRYGHESLRSARTRSRSIPCISERTTRSDDGEQARRHGRHVALHARGAHARINSFPTALVPPAPPPPPTYLPNNPTSLPGLQLWLPAYDPTKYFSDFGSFANPLPLVPFDGMSTRSMIEASANAFRVQTDDQYRQVLYAHDSVIGPYWVHKAKPARDFGSEWLVHNPALGTVPNQFDFVQNTGVFTLSTFVNVGAATGGYMTIFDTSEGFYLASRVSALFVQQNGRCLPDRHRRNR